MQIQLQDLLNAARGRFKKGRLALAAIILPALLFPAAFSQEATQTAPWAYKLRFENEWVRVIRVHYEPREKIPAHAHTKWPCAYVYLNDGGPIIFRHKDWEHPELTRPATKAGSFRLSPTTAVNEVHEVENPTDIPSDFLRVEFKTEPVGRKSLRGRFYREEYPAGENFRKVQFENEQIRVTRLVCAPHKSLDVAASSSEPALFVILSVAHLRTKSAVNQTTLEPGQTIWVANAQQERFENLGDTPLELLRLDLRTAPVESKEGPKKAGRGAQDRSSDERARREVAVTFDDLPASLGNQRVVEINRNLVESLTRHRIPAIGFVNEGKLYVRGETDARIALLRMWLDAGLELGNHTFSHIQINSASLAQYKEDVIRGETVTRMLLRERGMRLRYFRHTQLRTGPTPEYERELNRFLTARGYTVAPVTIDNQEWVYAAAYAAARERGDKENEGRIAREYLKYIEECFAFFERLSADFLGYEVKQTLLLHANELNADHFDALVKMMEGRGYTFITLDEALKDKAYRLPVAQSKMGLSWLHRWMMAKGLKMRSEPREPEWVNRLVDRYARR